MRNHKFKLYDVKSRNIVNSDNYDVSLINGVVSVTDKNIILLKFTGKLDILNNEIYEGDIVEGNFLHAKKCVVVWNDIRCGYFLDPIIEDNITITKNYKMNSNSIKIIGSIYQNN